MNARRFVNHIWASGQYLHPNHKKGAGSEDGSGITRTFLLVAFQKLRGALPHGLAEHAAEIGRVAVAAQRTALLHAVHAAEQQIGRLRHAQPGAVLRRRFICLLYTSDAADD